VRIFKTYGVDAVQVISDNPYRLARDIRGIGFKTADQIALRLGIAKTAMIRARAGITFALAEAMDEGHCGLPAEELRALAAELLEIPGKVVDAALGLELAEGAVVADTVALEGGGDHRRARGGQDHAGQHHPTDPPDEDLGHHAGRAYGPGGQAAERGHRPGGQDLAPAARGRPRPGRVQAARR
jgi:hypothetical protein